MQAEQIHRELLQEIERRSRFGRIRRALTRPPKRRDAPPASPGPQILFVCPWLAVGGAEFVALEIIKGLENEFRFAIATTLEHPNPAGARFLELTPFIYYLGALGERGAGGFLPHIASRLGIGCVVINWSQAGYEATPELKSLPNTWVGNIIHNAVPEGWISHAIRYDRYIDKHFPVGPEPLRVLTEQSGIGSNKICLARNGVDVTQRFNPANYRDRVAAIRSELGLEDSPLVVSFVGRLSPEKDPGLFVKAVAELTQRDLPRPVKGLIVGDGEERPAVERLIAEMGMAGVIKILGLRDDVAGVLAVSDYLLLTSHIEGAPLSPLEALSMGVPVVSTDVGNMREMISNGANGWVVDGRDPVEMARRIVDLEASPEVTTEATRASVVDRFDVKQMVDVYRKEFRQALDAYNR